MGRYHRKGRVYPAERKAPVIPRPRAVPHMVGKAGNSPGAEKLVGGPGYQGPVAPVNRIRAILRMETERSVPWSREPRRKISYPGRESILSRISAASRTYPRHAVVKMPLAAAFRYSSGLLKSYPWSRVQLTEPC